jgi:cell division protein FtsB
MKLPKIFYSKYFLFGVIVVLIGVFALELPQWEQRRKINSEISQLKTQQSELEANNAALEQSLQYFASSNYQEKLAREQLGLKKDGEIVVNFPPGGVPTGKAEQPEKPQSNPEKWWQYLFKKS